MTTSLVIVLAAAGGALIAGLLVHLYAAAALAAVVAERHLLADRVIDLEAALSQDAETASALRPLGDAMARLESHVDTLERDRVDQFAVVRTVLSRVESETAALGRQTQSLAGSLNAATVRGAWGEVQLKRVLEHAGMLARCDFDEQAVRLLADHARALKSHVTALASKDYWSAFDNTPEAVICFVPSDAVLASALAADPSLYDAALAKRVVLVGPGSLLALLRAVAFTWQQDSVAGSARELLVAARALYGRLGTMGGHVAMMGRSLQRSVETYNQFVGTLETRVLPSARRMHELGVGDAPLATFAPIEQGPRILTAAELLDAVAAADARPELLLTEPRKSPGAATG